MPIVLLAAGLIAACAKPPPEPPPKPPVCRVPVVKKVMAAIPIGSSRQTVEDILAANDVLYTYRGNLAHFAVREDRAGVSQVVVRDEHVEIRFNLDDRVREVVCMVVLTGP